MDSTIIYEKIMLEKYFNEIKCYRNSWKDYKGNYEVDSFIDITSNDYKNMENIIKQSNDSIYDMISEVVQCLIKIYGIDVTYYKLLRNDAYEFVFDGKECTENLIVPKERKILTFSIKSNGGLLFIFKEFGAMNRIPDGVISPILKQYGLKNYCYVSLVEDNAYFEVINHNDDIDDPTRGTNIFSLKQFFERFFGIEEYNRFKEFSKVFSEKVKSFYGFAIVRTLIPNSLYNFRKEIKESISQKKEFYVTSFSNIKESVMTILLNNFYTLANSELLTGSSDFAQSFMTAEWLYNSLENAGNIDLTSITSGYFKAIEQFVFRFICLHTLERDGKSRLIFIGKGKPNADSNGCILLTDAFINDEPSVKSLTMASLFGFLGYYDANNYTYYGRNKDLLCPGIDDVTYDNILWILSDVMKQRNTFFHRTNLTDWQIVENVRNTTYKLLFLIMSSYSLSDSDKDALGLIPSISHDDYYKLCNYINRKAYEEDNMLKLPIFYLGENSDINNYWFPKADGYIKYDEYGDQIFSGLYFYNNTRQNPVIKCDKEHLPSEIWEGYIEIPTDSSFAFKCSGPKEKIFGDKCFLI